MIMPKTRIGIRYDTVTRNIFTLRCSDNNRVNTGDEDADIIFVQADGLSGDAELSLKVNVHKGKHVPADISYTIPLSYKDSSGLWSAILSEEIMSSIAGLNVEIQVCVRMNRKRELSVNTLQVHMTQAIIP